MAAGPAADHGGNERAAGASPTDGEATGATFRGVTELSLDAKGRLAIPARHRDGLVNGSGGELVLTADPGGCLLIFPRLAWEPLQQQLMSFSSFNETVRRLQRLLVGHADDVEIDAAGRILVPPALRRFAGLDKYVVLVGQGRKLELWDASRWQALTAQSIALPADLPSDLAGFSL
ncbi:MAG: division/cell wall cluster transcriptional repressor MraZ [Proteobacteria bacterium]|nr:division/cell wall cluster transcriptional repressor MraZ [Pseudomonadota bacterium]